MFIPIWKLVLDLGWLAMVIIASVFDNEWDWDKYDGK